MKRRKNCSLTTDIQTRTIRILTGYLQETTMIYEIQMHPLLIHIHTQTCIREPAYEYIYIYIYVRQQVDGWVN